MNLPQRSKLAHHWNLDEQCTFLNHGSFGATPTEIIAEQRKWQDLLEAEPVRFYEDLAERFNIVPGLSDHTMGYVAPIVSVCFGARVIEKHFILDHTVGGPDASFSLDENISSIIFVYLSVSSCISISLFDFNHSTKILCI